MISLLLFELYEIITCIVLLFARLVVNQLLLIGFNFSRFFFHMCSSLAVTSFVHINRIKLTHMWTFRLSSFFVCVLLLICESFTTSMSIYFQSDWFFFCCFSLYFGSNAGCLLLLLLLVVLGHFQLWQVRFFLHWCYCHHRLMCLTIWLE